MTRTQWKLVVILIVLAGIFYLIYPTYQWYRMSPNERVKLEKVKDPILKKILNLGLDLKGGMHLILEVDIEKLDDESTVADAVGRAIEVIRNRIDQFGVSEPLIAKQGKQWIVVQLPGIKDVQSAKDLIGKTALLEFKLVDNSDTLSKIQEKLLELDKGMSQYKDENGDVIPEVKEIIPEGMEIVQGKENSYYILNSKAELTGAYLLDARMEFGGNTGYPHVSLKFNSDGAKLFSKTTGNNIGRNLAIVLDGIVQSSPVIRSRIPDGQAIIEGTFSQDDAKFLATVLRAGALPAPVNIIEERTVGPSLGEDSVSSGFNSTVLGFILIIIFMMIYYKFSGMIANFALLFNLLIILGIMAYLRATLTLPGIAGMILSLGMAVDANVLIFERIREELRLGKTVRVAIDIGYQKAFSAIIDGNITTLLAAIFLFQFGTGPIKGFAVTLTIGLIASMFTAIVVTRTIFEYTLSGRVVQKLSI
ncbi:MAG: protein translocase subunit SecD [bacterium]